MRTVIQRVSEARVEVGGKVAGQIGCGLLILLGVGKNDTRQDADYLADKLAGLRIFADESGKMNLNVRQAGGAMLVVSQFTLYADVRRGRRPGFEGAADPHLARALYEYFIEAVRLRGIPVQTGEFQTSMLVHLSNDGPVTIFLDSERIT